MFVIFVMAVDAIVFLVLFFARVFVTVEKLKVASLAVLAQLIVIRLSLHLKSFAMSMVVAKNLTIFS